MKHRIKQNSFSLIALLLMLVMFVCLVPANVFAEDWDEGNMYDEDFSLDCPIKDLEPIVTQGETRISPEVDSGTLTYIISKDKQDLTIDYKAEVDMRDITSPGIMALASLVYGENTPDSPWELFLDKMKNIENTTVIKLKLKLDPQLELDEADWKNIKFTSDFFNLDKSSIAVDTTNNTVALTFHWDSENTNANGSPIVTLTGVPMKLKDWSTDELTLTSGGTIEGNLDVKYGNKTLQIVINESSKSSKILLKTPATPVTPAPAPAPAPVVAPTDPPAETATLYFDPNGGIWPSGSAEPMIMYAAVGDMVRLPLAPSKEGANFVYWEGSRYNPGELYEVTGDHSFTAYFEDYSSAFAGTTGKPADNQQQAPVGNQQSVTDLPKTGEQSTAPAVIASLAGLSILIVLRKKISK
ncbi:MAG: LPXTG cell wall anchor domain-containing protein [Eubacteriales bacterium]|nr:LPXTG cell wall anchor domain-containing protein [Eubacteriales bacterium]